MKLLRDYLNQVYGKKMYKISLDGGFTCPNRDGTKGVGGCIFCSEMGSGDFSAKINSNNYNLEKRRNNKEPSDLIEIDRLYKNIDNAMEKGKERIRKKYKGESFIAYFQAFTNTYAPIDYLEKLYTYVINKSEVEILSIATRPDCISAETLNLIEKLNKIKPVWVELGLQTTKKESIEYINRCYENEVYEDIIKKLNDIGVHTITHIILGLPGESRDDMINSVKFVIKNESMGIKLQLLHVLKGTRLARDYRDNKFKCMEEGEYFGILEDIIRILPDDMVVHRLTGDGDKKVLIAPLWSTDKKKVLSRVNDIIEKQEKN